MSDDIHLKEQYVLARCCSPVPGDAIVGYYSHTNVLKVHRADCNSLRKADQTRLVALNWPDILAEVEFSPGEDYASLDSIDFAVLRHHREFGVDYSLMVARQLGIEKQAAFDSHRKLRQMDLLRRVEPTMIRYRKGIVDNKWIKHRNHTYYELTDKGLQYLQYHLAHDAG